MTKTECRDSHISLRKILVKKLEMLNKELLTMNLIMLKRKSVYWSITVKSMNAENKSQSKQNKSDKEMHVSSKIKQFQKGQSQFVP